MFRAMPRLSTSLILALLFALVGCGGRSVQTAPTTAPAAESAPSERSHRTLACAATEGLRVGLPRPFLYEVRHGQNTSLLFGTIHAGVAAQRALGDRCLEAVKRARILLTELPLEVDQRLIVSAMMLPEGQSLRALVGDARFEQIAARIDGAPPELLDRFAPWAAVVAASVEEMKQIAAARGGDRDAVMDQEIQKLATRFGVPNDGLETPEAQLALFTEAPLAALLRMADRSFSEEGYAEGVELFEAYLAGDEVALHEMSDMDYLEDIAPEFLEAILPARNRAWLPRLTDELQKGGVFVAVGAGHLFGEDGLLELLAKAGFEIRRLTFD